MIWMLWYSSLAFAHKGAFRPEEPLLGCVMLI